MTNAKVEFEEETKGNDILCSSIRIEETNFDLGDSKVFVLRIGYTQSDLDSFFRSLDFEYDDGYGSQNMYGTIWYTDGTWSERNEYDGSEWWSHKQVPKIPEECKGTSN